MGDIDRRTACLWAATLPFITACRSSEIPSNDIPVEARSNPENLEDHLRNTTFPIGINMDCDPKILDIDGNPIMSFKEERLPGETEESATSVYNDEKGTILISTQHMLMRIPKLGQSKEYPYSGRRKRVKTITSIRAYIRGMDDHSKREEDCEILMQDPDNDIMLIRSRLKLLTCNHLAPEFDFKGGLDTMITAYPGLIREPVIIRTRTVPIVKEGDDIFELVEGREVFEGTSGCLVHLVDDHRAIGIIRAGVGSILNPRAPIYARLIPARVIEKSLRDHGFDYVADAMLSRN